MPCGKLTYFAVALPEISLVLHARCNSRLRLRLAGGEFELVRRVLWQLRAALANELQHLALADTDRTAALANYSEATEMLVLQVMLPCGELTEASALVSNDAHLGRKEKGQLFRACEASAPRLNGERRSEPVIGAGVARNTSSAATNGDGSAFHGVGGRAAARGRPQRGNHTTAGNIEPSTDDDAARHRQHQQGAVQNFFSSVSDWTPEARIQLVVGAGAASLAAYATLRNRESLWRAARSAAGVAVRTAGDIGGFIVGAS